MIRLDVMNLQEQLDLKLQQRQARETGICQVCYEYSNYLKKWNIYPANPLTLLMFNHYITLQLHNLILFQRE